MQVRQIFACKIIHTVFVFQRKTSRINWMSEFVIRNFAMEIVVISMGTCLWRSSLIEKAKYSRTLAIIAFRGKMYASFLIFHLTHFGM